jgi:hypothetical protein
MLTISITTQLPRNTSLEFVTQMVTDMEHVNYELSPFISMSYPPNARNLRSFVEGKILADKQPNTIIPLFTSTLSLFGWIPIDWHHLAVQETAGTGFVEVSRSSLMHRVWRHERRVQQTEDTGDEPPVVSITDVVSYESYFSLIGYLLYPILYGIFAHRHRRIVRRLANTRSNL